MISDISKVEVQMDFEHWLVHTSKLFWVSDLVTGSAAVNYYIKTGATPLHILSSLSAGAGTTFQLIEDANVTVNGSAITIYNHNRSSSNTLLSVGYKGCTYTGGTIIKQNQAGFGANQGQAVSGAVNAPIEYVLKPNSNYVLLITPSTSTTFYTESEMYELALS